MRLWRFRLGLDPMSAFGTPPTSGTLFGHLCWAKRTLDGQELLRDWLTRLPQTPTAISDLLPADHLPKPLLLSGTAVSTEDAKALKKRRYIPLAAWKRLRIGAGAKVLEDVLREARQDPPFLVSARSPHNRIDRTSGKTPEAGGGGIWFADEWWPVPQERGSRRIEADLYLRSALPQSEAEALIRHVGEAGFGRDASTGRGRFRIEGSEAMDWLDDVPPGGGGARLLSLSQGVITPNMIDVRWKRFVLFGKIGRQMVADGKRPWKLPLLLAEAGATFATTNTGPYGAWVTGVHQDDAEIGHNGFHLTIPYTEGAQ